MKILFLADYIGRETSMKEYKKGDRAEIQFEFASELVRLGIAVDVSFDVEELPKTKKVKYGKDT